ncbi:ARL4 [Mytilus coruscus]|uniref:ADP-ribosylation factor-like protein 11 n=1 Tax=Mytilus coruscus TaxID=42192 RepID=A0A6J8DL98_MYTCO|nr:ARL4 [Mytilus coruscus]
MGGSSSAVQLTMIGLDQSGKTTLLYRLKYDQYTNTTPTIGFNCEKVKCETGTAKGTTFTIWDIGGADKTRPLWRAYIRSSEGIIFVVDSVDKERIEEAKLELTKLIRCSDNPGLPILVIANKQDMPGSLDPVNVEKQLGLHELPPSQLWSLLGACAITGEGLSDAIEAMYELVLKRRRMKKKR